jgi:hypothetical protein
MTSGRLNYQMDASPSKVLVDEMNLVQGVGYMKFLVMTPAVLLLAGCASFSGLGGQYQSAEVVEIAKRPANFYDDVVSVGQGLGYQHTGGDRARNTVHLADQPNFGETMIGRAYSVQVIAVLRPTGRTVDLTFTSIGSRTTSAAKKSQQRIDELKEALRQRFGS